MKVMVGVPEMVLMVSIVDPVTVIVEPSNVTSVLMVVVSKVTAPKEAK